MWPETPSRPEKMSATARVHLRPEARWRDLKPEPAGGSDCLRHGCKSPRAAQESTTLLTVVSTQMQLTITDKSVKRVTKLG